MPNPKYALDRYNDVAKNGTAGLTKKQQIQAAAQSQYTYTNITDAANVIKWGDNHLTTKAPHSYFDYYFAGQDIKIYIEGAETPEQGELPMMDFAFNMQQQKTPVYGFWSYTFDAVMKGTRIVSGQFRIATKSTDYMTNVISEAAADTVSRNSPSHLRNFDEDERNIEKYWTSNVDPDTIGYKHLFSTHPPFNFIVVYGLQSVSISPNAMDKDDGLYNQYTSNDNQLALDQNHRLVESDPINNTMRFIIDSVELTQLQVEYSPDGSVCSEVYGFFARDVRNIKTN